jgi:hypothetical protein
MIIVEMSRPWTFGFDYGMIIGEPITPGGHLMMAAFPMHSEVFGSACELFESIIRRLSCEITGQMEHGQIEALRLDQEISRVAPSHALVHTGSLLSLAHADQVGGKKLPRLRYRCLDCSYRINTLYQNACQSGLLEQWIEGIRREVEKTATSLLIPSILMGYHDDIWEATPS